MRRTKIIATLGPATDPPRVLKQMLEVGVDLFRLNYAHQNREEHGRRLREVRAVAEELGVEVGVIADMQGPKIRVQRFREGRVQLRRGKSFALDCELQDAAGDVTQVGVTYRNLPRDVRPGHILLLDDGRIILKVEAVSGARVNCKVVRGGELSDNKGVNLKGGGLSAGAMTSKDRGDMAHAVQAGVDYIAISFPRSADDIGEARHFLAKCGGEGVGIIAKIERAEALHAVEEIIRASDAIMIARGDLGVEIGDATLPPLQKRLIKLARSMHRGVITATQMMESMVSQPIPLRAEVFDVSNAVFDGVDAIMLSAETSIGRFPGEAVRIASRICIEAEKQRSTRVSDHRVNEHFDEVDEAVAMASMYVANHLAVKAIAAITETGSTCVWMSRISSGIPVFALSRNVRTRHRMRLFRGVYAVPFDVTQVPSKRVHRAAVELLEQHGQVRTGDLIIITRGDLRGRRGGTNTMKILRSGAENESPEI